MNLKRMLAISTCLFLFVTAAEMVAVLDVCSADSRVGIIKLPGTGEPTEQDWENHDRREAELHESSDEESLDEQLAQETSEEDSEETSEEDSEETSEEDSEEPAQQDSDSDCSSGCAVLKE